MKHYTVVFAPEALAQLERLYDYIANAAAPDIARRYIDAIIDYCESLQRAPLRGIKRDDIRTGLRITNYKKRAVIAFAVGEDRVEVIGVYYGGQDYESAILAD